MLLEVHDEVVDGDALLLHRVAFAHGDGAVTIRERDTTEQVRVPIAELVPAMAEKLGF